MFSGQVAFDPAGERKCSSIVIACTIDNSLSLRPLLPSDADELFALTDANRSYLRQWLPWLDNTRRVEDTTHFIQLCVEREQAQNEVLAAICYDSKIVGLVGLHEINWSNRSAGIGYWLAENFQGRGMMTLACSAIIEHGFAALQLNRIDICCAAENIRSEAIAKRLGLTYEGQLREAEWLYDHFVDHKVYAILRREWSQ